MLNEALLTLPSSLPSHRVRRPVHEVAVIMNFSMRFNCCFCHELLYENQLVFFLFVSVRTQAHASHVLRDWTMCSGTPPYRPPLGNYRGVALSQRLIRTKAVKW